MKLYFSLFFGIFCCSCLAQKETIKENTGINWPTIEVPAISGDGKYVLYKYKSNSKDKSHLRICKSDGQTLFETVNVSAVSFTPSSKMVVFSKPGDSVGLFRLNDLKVDYLSSVRSWKIIRHESEELLICQDVRLESQVLILNLENNNIKSFKGAVQSWLGPTGASLVLLVKSIEGNIPIQSLNLLLFEEPDSVVTFWKDKDDNSKVENVIFDNAASQLSFRTDRKVRDESASFFWYYNIKDRKLNLLSHELFDTIGNLQLESIDRFSIDGQRLFITLKEKKYRQPTQEFVKVNVWSYFDTTLQSYQQKNLNPKSYSGCFCIKTGKSILLEHRNEMVHLPTFNDSIGLVSISRKAGSEVDAGEISWNPNFERSLHIISTVEKKAIELRFEKNEIVNGSLSPQGKYFVYYSPLHKSFFSYEIATKISRNITSGVMAKWTWFEGDLVNASFNAYPVAGWLVNDKAVLLYDQSDIWQADPTGKERAINLTNHFGSSHNIAFRFISKALIIDPEKSSNLILTAFDRKSKNNGFYSISLNGHGNPSKLNMGGYLFYVPDYYLGYEPIKAANSDAYLIRRMSANEYPNLYYTTDFKNIVPITDFQPEKNYNWFTDEMHTWNLSSGKSVKAILYKPENFNPNKKYPVIIHYYEIKSNKLNSYLKPESSYGDVNIPVYVSNGYLVFEPDVHVTAGLSGESALIAVTSAADYLSKLPFIDTKRIGIQGFSYGGFETNYIVTHTTRFRAACAGSGVSNYVSDYGRISDNGSSRQSVYEVGQHRVGKSLWQAPQLYIKNSPVFNANKVESPLLLMHTTHDGGVAFGNALEFFTALRRLQKQVWMLEYEQGDHGLTGKTAGDFSFRMQQFFDHYLKDSAAPAWMTRGIPARLKGIETGYALDPTGNCGKDCKVCKMWNDKMKKNSVATLKEMEGSH